jgi:hypothetical protein
MIMAFHTKQRILLVAIFVIALLVGIALSMRGRQVPTAYADYRDAVYEVEGTNIPLQDGYAEMPIEDSSAVTITEYFGNEAKGDLNGDGIDDVVFLLAQQSGGTGVFYYAALALGTEGGFRGANALFLGDRIAPQTTEIRGGEAVVNFAEHRLDEPMTTPPSVGVSKYFVVSNGKLAPSER